MGFVEDLILDRRVGHCVACSATILHDAERYVTRSWVDDKFLRPDEIFIFCGCCYHMSVRARSGVVRNLTKLEIDLLGKDEAVMRLWKEKSERFFMAKGWFG